MPMTPPSDPLAELITLIGGEPQRPPQSGVIMNKHQRSQPAAAQASQALAEAALHDSTADINDIDTIDDLRAEIDELSDLVVALKRTNQQLNAENDRLVALLEHAGAEHACQTIQLRAELERDRAERRYYEKLLDYARATTHGVAEALADALSRHQQSAQRQIGQQRGAESDR
ncbi:hypothetical protein [Bradyrhizobium sp.]|uniref:hypothetical protein n=1 Tax=Bradyrhizobium sp. TaxID=376 RepID=UPI0025C3FB56|nr:hypothetical protein [Bradyrhizobium sp.]